MGCKQSCRKSAEYAHNTHKEGTAVSTFVCDARFQRSNRQTKSRRLRKLLYTAKQPVLLFAQSGIVDMQGLLAHACPGRANYTKRSVFHAGKKGHLGESPRIFEAPLMSRTTYVRLPFTISAWGFTLLRVLALPRQAGKFLRNITRQRTHPCPLSSLLYIKVLRVTKTLMLCLVSPGCCTLQPKIAGGYIL